MPKGTTVQVQKPYEQHIIWENSLYFGYGALHKRLNKY